MNQAQQTGRLGELFVEHKLTKEGWLCGNFNISVTNSKSWDLFAKRNERTRVIRVKTAAKLDATWRIKPGSRHPFNDLAEGDLADWTAIVVNIENGSPDCYIIPTIDLAAYIIDAQFPLDWDTLHLYFRPYTREVNYPQQYGLDSQFQCYKNSWDLEIIDGRPPA